MLSLSSAPSLAVLVVAALLVTNTAFVLATLALHELTRCVMTGNDEGRRTTRQEFQQEEEVRERVAFLSALLYICSPASIFYTTAYSEVGMQQLSFHFIGVYPLKKRRIIGLHAYYISTWAGALLVPDVWRPAPRR